MSHIIGYFDMPKTAKEEDMIAYLNSFAYNPRERSGYHGGLTLHNDKVYESYEEAKKAITKLDNGWYDDHAVLYSEGAVSKATENAMKKIEELEKKYEQFKKTVFPKNFKSAYIGCPKCGSKINKNYIPDFFCPLCGGDLRSETTKDRMCTFEKNIKDAKAKYRECLKKDSEKAKKRVSGVRWLVKYEYHC